jgi:peptide-methionine (S)-S-oxide reductase
MTRSRPDRSACDKVDAMMRHAAVRFLVPLLLGGGLSTAARSDGMNVPPPVLDMALEAPGSPGRTAVFAGGCFWGIEAVYRHVLGVNSAVSGYAGGSKWNANYTLVSMGVTGHAESVEVTYDPSRVTYGQLLRVFFSVAHDPTQLDRQGPDEGTQYRSAVFFKDAEQQRIARAFIAQLDRARIFSSPIVTKVTALTSFYEAEAYHQDYAALHPMSPYIVINDAPKVAHLRELFPDFYVGK